MTQIHDMWVTPGPQPNGLQAASDGLWVIDQTDDHLYKLGWDDGSVLEKLPAEVKHSSGVTVGGGYIWISSTFDVESAGDNGAPKLVKCNLDGSTAERYETPGVGVVSFGDPNRRRVTGAHGMEWVDDENMWVAVPPAQKVFLMDPATMTVKRSIPTPGPRPHGMSMHEDDMWLADTGMAKVHKLDPESGEVLDEMDVPDPEVHGMTVHDGRMWFCCAVTCRVCSVPLP